MDINKTVPNRRDLGGSLVIGPSGRGYFVNFHRKQFHWSNQFGSSIYEAEHQNSINYIDFDAGDEMNRLFYNSPTGKQQLRCQTGNLISHRAKYLESLRDEVSELFANDGIVMVESERESFLVDFEDGHILSLCDTRNLVDIIYITRVNITLKHELWNLKFALFQVRMPCRCGLVKHTDVEALDGSHNNLHYCLVETTRDYDDLISLTASRGTKIPLIDFFRKTSLEDMGITKTVPNRRDLRGSLVIGPSGRGYFVNFHKKKFHWSNQFGSSIYEAEHQNSINYIDFDAGDEMNRLFYNSPTGKQQLRCQTGNLIGPQAKYLESLRDEVSELFANDGIVMVESERESFLVDFEDGHILSLCDIRNLVDIIYITRVNITLKHELWNLKFALFQARMPCRCGLVKHTDVEALDGSHNNLHYCLVETTRDYDDLISLTASRGTKIPLLDHEVAATL